MSVATVVDDEALADCLNEIACAPIGRRPLRDGPRRTVQHQGRAAGGRRRALPDAGPGEAVVSPGQRQAQRGHVRRPVGLREDEGKAKPAAAKKGMASGSKAAKGRAPSKDSAAYNYAKIFRDLKRELCCSGIVVKDEDLGNVVQLQGDRRKAVTAFLIKAGIVTKANVKILGSNKITELVKRTKLKKRASVR
ncbi:hypothetical protein BAE44_0015599 [Dichanthelium oligosanthes]|uniref:SUI1 domain-containing protein n=1 Tax=Dichanthelium oligosanthes TaxID=888268 RepID=A0A1E5VE09_9POAL|nr:hypothetical protein BAE44_0015599 [Dichanthelium oligosanthes]